MISCLNKCLPGSNLGLEWGAMLDMRRNAKKEVRNIALYNTGSCNLSQALDMPIKVSRPKVPLGVGVKVELIEILLR